MSQLKKYIVITHQDSSVTVEAERMALLDKQVTLYIGDQIKAHFPHIDSVLVLPAQPELVGLIAGSAPFFPSSLSEAIESAARLLSDLERDAETCRITDPRSHFGVYGRIYQHLDNLLAAQFSQVSEAFATVPLPCP